MTRAIARFSVGPMMARPVSRSTTSVASSVSAVPPATAEMMNMTGSDGLNQMARPDSTP